MPAVGRITDPFTDGDIVATGSGDVFANNISVTRITDTTAGHNVPGHGFYPSAVIVAGSGTVFANNLALARVGDAHTVHVEPPHGNPPAQHPHDGTISAGSANVFADS